MKVSCIKEYSEVYVKKWVDYSSKYGLGFMMSDESVGVFFNDNSKICCKGEQVLYMNKDLSLRFKLSDCPEDLAKKTALLNHFRSYMNPNKNVCGDP